MGALDKLDKIALKAQEKEQGFANVRMAAEDIARLKNKLPNAADSIYDDLVSNLETALAAVGIDMDAL